jgi:Ras-related C3 botulinum toxin substrate 1
MESVKLVIVGDGGVGKTSLLYTYTHGQFPDDHMPCQHENMDQNLILDGKPIRICLWDTAGQDDYDRLRPLSYPQTDIFIVAFDVHNHASFEQVKNKWVPELSHHAPGVPIILLGTKTDLRDASSVTDAEARAAAKTLGMATYIEVSAKQEGGSSNACKALFDEAARTALAGKGKRKKKKSGWFGSRPKAAKPKPAAPAKSVSTTVSSGGGMGNVKVVVVGDGAVGKSCLLIAYTTNAFPNDYIPTVFDNYSANVVIDGKPFNLGLVRPWRPPF